MNRVDQILVTNGLDPAAIIRPANNWDKAEFRGRNGRTRAQVGVEFHGLTKTDNVVVNGVGADQVGEKTWHGMGLYVEGVKDPQTLLRLGGLDWTVEQLALAGIFPADADGGSDTVAVDSHVLNIRSDTKEALGVVGKGYKPFHNHQLIELVQALGADCEIETLGTLQGGRRVWALVRASSFDVTPRDTTATYLAASAGHDGSMAINLFWTSVRTSCLNTFRRAFRGRKNGIAIRHEGGVMEKVEAAKEALGLMAETTRDEAAQALALNARTMTTEQLRRFWIDTYSKAEGAIPAKPETAAEVKAAEKAQGILKEWEEVFEKDLQRSAGQASLWTAYNAVTEWYDHHRPTKGKDAAAREDNRIYGNLWGAAAERKTIARENALAHV